MAWRTRRVGQITSPKQSSDGMLWRILDRMVAQALEFDRSAVFVFQKSGTPYIIYDNFSDMVEAAYLERFLQSSYVIYPVYQAFLDGDMPTVSTARELAARNPVHKELPYLLSLHISPEPNVISDEVYITLTKGSICICYGAIRRQGAGHFTAEDVARAEKVAPKIIELLEHFSNLMALPKEMDEMRDLYSSPVLEHEITDVPHGEGVALGSAQENKDIDDIFRDKLSPREHASISMTLRGKSVDNIAYALNISPHTVRVHMRNAYAKLQVRNRLELFAMFLRLAGFHDRGNGSEGTPRT